MFALVVILTIDGTAAARGLAALALATIKVASGVGKGKDKGFPINAHPLANTAPPTPDKQIGSRVGFGVGPEGG
tara:strand:+ start:298 stop:519 length:222 start_codon:yes stop_codon:yes gene_type:complete